MRASGRSSAPPARPGYTRTVRALGIASSLGIVCLSLVYGATLASGLISLPASDAPVGEPWFSLLEALIVLVVPLMVVLMVAIHAWAPPERRPFAVAGIVFMTIMACLTISVHFVILTVSGHLTLEEHPWASIFLSFEWPSVAYALDILAWDFFFPIAVFFAAAVFSGPGLERVVKGLLVLSGLIALGGIAGAVLGNLQVRNVGIVGYGVVFPGAALLLSVLFLRTAPELRRTR